MNATIVGVALIAAAGLHAVLTRYEGIPAGVAIDMLYVVDRITGSVHVCRRDREREVVQCEH